MKPGRNTKLICPKCSSSFKQITRMEKEYTTYRRYFCDNCKYEKRTEEIPWSRYRRLLNFEKHLNQIGKKMSEIRKLLEKQYE